jgi:hypothetical protein
MFEDQTTWSVVTSICQTTWSVVTSICDLVTSPLISMYSKCGVIIVLSACAHSFIFNYKLWTRNTSST